MVDLIAEKEAAKAWEELNMPTDTETLHQAAKSLGYAIEDLDTSLDLVNEAAELLVDTPEGDRVSSLLQEMESALKDLRGMQRKWQEAKA